LRNLPLLVSDTGGPRGLVGTTFDYLARFHIARELRGSSICLHRERSVPDHAIERLKWRGEPAVGDWEIFIAEAHAEEAAYIDGGGDVRRLAELSQFLAMMDICYRSGDFNPEFRPLPTVSEEVIQLLDLFNPVPRLSPQRLCFLNPTFAAASHVGGADADLVVDDRLIDLKTTANLSVSLDNLVQLAGYTALNQLAGIKIGEDVSNPPS
jgi:hypothetical protein